MEQMPESLANPNVSLFSKRSHDDQYLRQALPISLFSNVYMLHITWD